MAARNLTAAIFDMDRTLVRANTGVLYMRWRYARGEAGPRDLLRFSWWVAQYHLGVVDPAEVIRRSLRPLQGTSEDTFRRDLAGWYAGYVRPRVSKDACAEVERRRARGDVVAILTASTPYATDPLARDLDIPHVLCTTLEVKDGRFTGTYDRLCYGAGKVHVAERWAAQHNIDLAQSSFYTDSITDAPMLARVGDPRVINPDPRLRWRAKRQGWPIERWS